MKLNSDFLVHVNGNETMLVPTGKAGFSGIVRGNETLGSLLELLKTERTEEELISEMKSMYDAPEGAIEKDVKKTLTELKSIGAIDE